nr:RNA-directed DNA polymerase, eukaryota, reverse transcriptase zinc-binding domain protein [Tanacetum cinerariifolium]
MRLKGGLSLKNVVEENKPTLVLDDTCLNQEDFSKSLIGKVKDFRSLTNLKVALDNEGFNNIKLKYMGGYWVMIEFQSEDSKEKFKTNVGTGSWFSQLQQASSSFHIDERVTWVNIEGMPLKVWNKNTFNRIVSKWGDIVHVDDQDKTCFQSKRICIKTKVVENIFESFKIIYKGKVFWVRAKEVSGWTPDFADDEEVEYDSDGEIKEDNLDDENAEIHEYANVEGKNDFEEVSKIIFWKVHSQAQKMNDLNTGSEDPFNIYDLLNKNKDTNNGGEKASDEWLHDIQDETIVSEVGKTCHVSNSKGDKEDKEESICSGHFEKVEVPRLGGGILCVWDPKMFSKINSTVSDYFVIIRGEWIPNGANAFNSFILAARLEEVPLGEQIRVWIKDKTENANKQKMTLKEELSDIDTLLDKGEANSDVLNKRDVICKSLQDIEKLASMKVAQKVKIKWAIEGDENSKYYHGIINKRRSQLTIHSILVDGTWIDFPSMGNMGRTNQSPGPDGFTFGFFRRYWNFLVKDVVQVVYYFFQHGTFPKGSLYKIIAKILANRLVVVLGDIVNEVQSAFTMIFKVDFKKAYDLVRWDYSDDVLKNFSFGERWCGWIQSCLRSLRGSIMMNDSPTNEFQFHRGLKQGDPLSSFLFILVMESLHILVQIVVDAGMFKACLSKWKMKTLSIRGRLTLLKSVLGCTPIYHLLLFKAPMKVLQKMESIRCHFFNGIDHNGKKPIWIKWNKFLASKEKGGLGVSSLYALNRALLFKWVSRFYTQRSSLWAKVIRGIHGEDGKLCKNIKQCHPTICLDIVHGIMLLKSQGSHLCSFIHKKMGNGLNISFWQDVWTEDSDFKSAYPRIYALESHKNITVAEKMSHENLGDSFYQTPRGGIEQDQFMKILASVEGIILVEMHDRWVWSKEGSGFFLVVSARRLIDDYCLLNVSTKTRSINVAPIKINVHAWKVKLDCLPTRLNISRRGMYIDFILCPSCGVAVESTSHVFFSCHIAREVFHKIPIVVLPKRSYIYMRFGLITFLGLLSVWILPRQVWTDQLGRVALLSGILFLMLGRYPAYGGSIKNTIVFYDLMGLPSIPPSYDGYSYLLFKLGLFQLIRKGLSVASTSTCLTFTVFQSERLCLTTTTPEQLTFGLKWFMKPLKYISVSVDEVILTFLLSLRFINLVFDEVRIVAVGIVSRRINWQQLATMEIVEGVLLFFITIFELARS